MTGPASGVRHRHLTSSVRVALVATLVVAAVYAGAVALLDALVADRLVAQVDGQLASRLAAARVLPPALATAEPDSPRGGIHYGLGIYGVPIYVWEVRRGAEAAVRTLGAPRLPGGAWPESGAGSRTRTVAGTAYRLSSVPYRGGLLVAGESLAELTHVEGVLTTSELVAAPVLVLAVFLASLLIALRSAAPVELARRRQLEFTSDASHELRTPLSVIEAELALARPTSPGPPPEPSSAEGALERIAPESRRLKRIVEDLLWLARFDSLPPQPGPEPVDLPALVTSCAERFETVAGARRLGLEVVRLGVEPAVVVAPAEWIDRLVGVLLDNACKYAPEGGSVRVEVGRLGQRVVLAVEDSGPGLPAADREQLFDRFRRGGDGTGGHGLGLAIADSVVRSTGGRWRVGDAPAPLGGARLEVSWPKDRRPGR